MTMVEVGDSSGQVTRGGGGGKRRWTRRTGHSASLSVAPASSRIVDRRLLSREFGRTETLVNTSDPQFTRQFLMDYYFYEAQHVQVSRCPRAPDGASCPSVVSGAG